MGVIIQKTAIGSISFVWALDDKLNAVTAIFISSISLLF